MDLNYDGLIVESHCCPDQAWSDKEQQIMPDVLSYILNLLVIRDTKQTTESLNELRQQIDQIDDELLSILSKRMRISREIGQYKKEHNMPVLQTVRYDEILGKRISQAHEMGMGSGFMKEVLEAIHEESIRQQIEVLNQ
jgi:chorismate mutase